MITLETAMRRKRRRVDVIEETLDHRFRHVKSHFDDVPEIAEVTTNDTQSKALLLDHDFGSNYTHWIIDMLPKILFLKRSGIEINKIILNPNTINRFHVVQWSNLLGLDRTTKNETDCRTVNFPTANTSLVHPTALNLLRSFIPTAKEQYPCFDNLKMLVQRGSHGTRVNTSRNLETRREFLNLTHDLGFSLIYTDELPVLQQIAMFNSASLIIAVHGSSLTNTVFCNDNAKILEIRSPLFWNSTYAEIGAYLELDYTIVKGTEKHGNTDIYSHCIHIDPKALENLTRTKLQ